MMNTAYPYNRSDECSWQPEEAARRLGSLLPTSTIGYNTSYPPQTYDPIRQGSTSGSTNDINNDAAHTVTPNTTNLLTRGRNSIEIRTLRHAFGSNTLHGDEIDDPTSNRLSSRMPFIQVMKQSLTFILPILHAFKDQLKEPLIIMLLVSAGISLFLGNAADAVSIALALSIVSLVAAIQEYRSEKGKCCVIVWVYDCVAF